MLIANLGPIRRAGISLRPLTIFIGKANTGKSYAAMLAHSVMSAGRGLAKDACPPANPVRKAVLEMVVSGLDGILSDIKPDERARCPRTLTAMFLRSCADRYRALLRGEIERNFGSGVAELARSGSKHFSMSVKAGGRRIMAYRRGRLELDSLPQFGIELSYSWTPNLARPVRLEWDGDVLRCNVEGSAGSDAEGRIRTLVELCGKIESAMLRRAVEDLPPHSYCLPAARSGMVQAYGVIAPSIARSSIPGGAGACIPGLSGAASDLVSDMAGMRPDRGVLPDAWSRLESELLGGRVRMRRGDQGSIPEVFYERPEAAVPAGRMSSAASGLAPFVLHLKRRAGARGVLVVEEPEAHLHPRDQALLAAHMVGLVRGGSGIIAVTHSPAFLEIASQCLRASRLRPEGRRRALGRGDLYLREDEIAVNLFKDGGDGGGSVAEPVALSAEEGIDQEEFVMEDRLMNERSLRIEEQAR